MQATPVSHARTPAAHGQGARDVANCAHHNCLLSPTLYRTHNAGCYRQARARVHRQRGAAGRQLQAGEAVGLQGCASRRFRAARSPPPRRADDPRRGAAQASTWCCSSTRWTSPSCARCAARDQRLQCPTEGSRKSRLRRAPTPLLTRATARRRRSSPSATAPRSSPPLTLRCACNGATAGQPRAASGGPQRASF